MNPQGMDAKTGLNQFCQRCCSRPVTKSDIVYSTTKFGSSQFQAIVKLNCMQGQEYAGELVANPKDAEKSAAQQALQAFSGFADNMPPSLKGWKPPIAPEGTDAAMLGGISQMAESYARAEQDAGVGGLAGNLLAALPRTITGPASLPCPLSLQQRPGGATGPTHSLSDHSAAATPVPGAPTISDLEVKLNAACMKIAKRALQKGETVYDTRQISIGKAPSGYQATVQLSCLPDRWAAKLFAGQVSANKQRAEHSAANAALAAIMADADLSALVAKASSHPATGGDRGRGGRSEKGAGTAGEGRGKGKNWGSSGWAWTQSGPDLPRERVTEAPVTGVVLEWKGTFGWIRPDTAVEHEQATKRDGKVWVHRQDLQGLESLNRQDVVQFHIYSDPSGLGAEEVVCF